MAGNASFRNALLITAIVLVVVAIGGYLLFPKVIEQFVHWLLGLMIVVLGLFFQRKK